MESKNNISSFQITVSVLRSNGIPVKIYNGQDGLQIATIGYDNSRIQYTFNNQSELAMKEEKK